MNTVILGGSSFVGVYVASELLSKRGGVVSTGRNPKFKDYYDKLGVPYEFVDLRKPETFSALDKYDIDAIVLCAVQMPANVEKDKEKEDIDDYYEVNVIATINLLDYCCKRGINKVITFGSRFDTRLYSQDTIIKEDTPLNFSYTDDHAAYVLTNKAKQEVMEYYNQRYGMHNIVLRVPSVFGVGPHGSFCKNGVYIKSGLQIFMEKAAAGETIEVYGSEDTRKDLLYVKDLATGVRLALESEKAQGLYNIGYKENFKLMDIVKAIVKVFSPKDKVSKIVARPDIPNNGGFPTMDCTKVEKELGWKPAFYDAEKMFADYKAEMERGVYSKLFS